MQYCPICGFADLGYRPFDDYGFPDEQVCPCCNVCPCCGYDFVQGGDPSAHRAGWIAGGMLWSDRYWRQAEGYDPVAQLPHAMEELPTTNAALARSYATSTPPAPSYYPPVTFDRGTLRD